MISLYCLKQPCTDFFSRASFEHLAVQSKQMPEAADPSMLDIADLILKIAIGIAGLYLAHSIGRQIKLRIAERRLEAYADLWAKMAVATPVRLASWIASPLTEADRERLFRSFTAWYYKNGNGMLLGGSTRALYLRVKDNLVCDLKYYKPERIRMKLEELPSEKAINCARGYLSIRQLSLLRTRMKADLDIYGPPYHQQLDEFDRELLRCTGQNLNRKPWTGRLEDTRNDDGEGRQDNVDPFANCLSMHIGKLNASSSPGSSGSWNAAVTIVVENYSHSPLKGAMVTVSWSESDSGYGSRITNDVQSTDRTGQFIFRKDDINRNTNEVTFTVTNVNKAGYEYMPGNNHDPDGYNDAASIVVSKPQ